MMLVQEPCAECGLMFEDATEGCHGVFKRLLERLSNPLYFRMHRTDENANPYFESHA